MTLDDQITFDDLDLDGPVPERSVELIHVRCKPALVAAVDNWIGRNGPPFVTRAAAVRKLMVKALKAEAGRSAA
jgi:hypothetical protein